MDLGLITTLLFVGLLLFLATGASLVMVMGGAAVIFSYMVGVSGAATVSMGLIALPSMLQRGYNKDISTGCISAGGALGVLIPPSIPFILYGLFSGESIGALFASGIVPGILLGLMFIFYILIRCFFQKDLGPALPKDKRATKY